VKQLQEGDSFGEMALLTSKPRAATIECIENCVFAIIEKNDYK
jgi:CRP-like cAMP-binding protein